MSPMTAKSPRMANRITTVSVWTAHGLAWVVGVWGSIGIIATGMFVERSGLTLVPAFLVPILLTYIALAAIHLVKPGQAKRKILLWCPAVALLVFCMLTIFSFGMIYLLVALALFVAAVADSRHRTAK